LGASHGTHEIDGRRLAEQRDAIHLSPVRNDRESAAAGLGRNTGGGAGVDAPSDREPSQLTLERVATILVPGAVANRRLTCFRAASVNSIADTLTISFGSNQLACAWAVYSMTTSICPDQRGKRDRPAGNLDVAECAGAFSGAYMFADPARSTLAGALMLRLARAVDAGSGLAEIDERQMPAILGHWRPRIGSAARLRRAGPGSAPPMRRRSCSSSSARGSCSLLNLYRLWPRIASW
jgi:hypothetical protein